MEHLDRRLLLAGAGLAGAASLIKMAHGAGPLSPPTGAIGATGKTTQEVYDKVIEVSGKTDARTPVNSTTCPGDASNQYRITQPGAYYLTQNLTGVSGKSGILIASDGVDLDLNGFALNGANLGLSAIIGQGTFQYRGTSIRRGSIRGWTGTAIALASTFQTRISEVNLNGPSTTGSAVGIEPGTMAVVEDCTVTVFFRGMTMYGDSLVSRCRLSFCGEVGIYANADGVIVESCSVQSCFVAGIQFDWGVGGIRGCAFHADRIGVLINGGGVVVEGNNFSRCDGGVECRLRAGALQTGHSRIINNHFADIGVQAQGSRVALWIGAGVSGHHVEGNSFSGNYRSIQVDSSFNCIVRNSSSFPGAGGDYTIAASNCVGTVVNASGGAALGVPDAWANIRY